MINLVAAVGRNLEIGNKGDLPWGRLPNDLRNFRELTKNRVLVMGRATFESMQSVDLRDRVVFVVSREFRRYPLAYHAFSVRDAVEKARTQLSTALASEIFVAGGVGVFRESLDYIDRAYITLVEGDYEADRFFPVGLCHFHGWRCVRSETFLPDDRNPAQHTFYVFDRPRNR